MVDADESATSAMRREIEHGLACAARFHYADAATHFALAREQSPSTETPLIVALDAFMECHARYWHLQQLLHEASHRFAVAHAEQQARLTDLQAVLSAMQSNREEVAAMQYPVEHSASLSARPPISQPTSNVASVLPGLAFTCFGRFVVWRAGEQIELCSNRNGQAILRYLVAHPRHSATMDVLMEALWPEDAADVARHKLHVAISALRCALNSGYKCPKGAGYLQCENGLYQLNPAVPIQIDAEEFVALYRSGQRTGGDAASDRYEAACKLYTGPFLPEDLYADWSLIQREQLAQMHLAMCGALAAHQLAHGRYDEAARWATRILEEDRCDETAHRQLMRAYAAANRRADALRQYQRCEHILADELGVQPMAETTALFYAILRGEPLPDPS